MPNAAMVTQPETLLIPYIRKYAGQPGETGVLATNLAYVLGWILSQKNATQGPSGQVPVGPEVKHIQEAIDGLVTAFKSQGQAEMAKLQDIQDDVASESTLIDGVSTLVSGLKQQVADALSGANLPPDVQAQVDKVFADVEANKAKLTAALAANTPIPPDAVTPTA